MSAFIEKQIVVGPFSCNCRILVCSETKEAVIVDSGDEANQILKALKHVEQDLGAKVKVTHLLHTHAHLDHIGATRDVKLSLKEQSPEIVLHKEDLPIYQALKMQGQRFGVQYDDPLSVDLFVEHEQEIRFGRQKISVVHTPGHSPGSVCFHLHQDTKSGAKETLYTGDTLFQSNVGRTDLWGGNEELMFKMIRERILNHDEDTRVCPGHGMNSTVGIEKRTNPYLV